MSDFHPGDRVTAIHHARPGTILAHAWGIDPDTRSGADGYEVRFDDCSGSSFVPTAHLSLLDAAGGDTSQEGA